MSRLNIRKTVSTWTLPAIALGLAVFAINASIQPGRTRAEPIQAPPQAPFANAVSGIGVVEPSSELIAVASDLPGVAREVFVAAGDRVAAGDPLFRLDGRAQEAALAQARASVETARAARRAAEVALADERQRLSLFESVPEAGAVSQDELARRRFAVQRAEAALAQADAQIRAAEAQVASVQTELSRQTVRAPIAGRIFDVNLRAGEFAPAGPTAQPLMTIGADGVLHVRVEIDEADAGRLTPQARAYGELRGRAGTRVPLTFVRFEPAVKEKRALTGGSERVDTRVVEAIYAFDPAANPVFLGQRMDVFVQAPAVRAVAAAPTPASKGAGS